MEEKFKIAENEEEIFRFTLGGESTYLRCKKEKPALWSQAPQRGYNLVLEDGLLKENS